MSSEVKEEINSTGWTICTNCAKQSKDGAPELAQEDFYKVLDVFFIDRSVEKVIFCLENLDLGGLPPKIVYMTISHAMKHGDYNTYEMTSRLIEEMDEWILFSEEMEAGFDMLLKNLPGLILHTPDAATVLGNFIARAMAYHSLSPEFLRSYEGKVECPHARKAIEHVDYLLSMENHLIHLRNIWGFVRGPCPYTVEYLITQTHSILKEYVVSGRSDDACVDIQILNMPHFHHELVYEAILMVLKDMQENSMDLMCKLFQTLDTFAIVTPDQMTQGFYRVYDKMPEICFDVPQAYSVLEKFVLKCQKASFLSDAVVEKMPSEGRKHFVSEGECGALT